jgi:alkylated DNA repair dioxygenase AlkB
MTAPIEAVPTDAITVFETGIIPASLTNDELVGVAVGAFTRIQQAMPYILELRKRFKKAPRNKADIAGCDTWEQFCETHLHRTASAIRKALQLESDNSSPYPKFEYLEKFITDEEGLELIQQLENSTGWVQKETGSCTIPPSHSTIHWGPRQAYLDCVPTEYRAKSAGDIPEFLIPLKTRLEEKYACVFNSAQVNKHFDHDAVVHAHTDSNAGHICMVSIGAERDFVLKSFAHGRSEFARLRQGSGSLLTFFPKEQHKHTHEMPKSKEPCGVRYSIIFRHIQPVLTVAGNLTKKVVGSWEEKKAINKQRDAEYRAAQNGEPMPQQQEQTEPAEQVPTVSDFTAVLTEMFTKLSALNALTKEIKTGELDTPTRDQVHTLIASLRKISKDTAERADRLEAAVAQVSA